MERTLTNTESNQISSFSVTAKESNSTASLPVSKVEPGVSEIDELLKEILGESYRDNTKLEQQNDESSESATPSKIKYITGSQELDDLVEAILGKDWEKDDGLPTARQIAPEYSQKELDELIESILGKDWYLDDDPGLTMAANSDSSQLENVSELLVSPEPVETDFQDSDLNLDALVESILSDSEVEDFVPAVSSESIDDQPIGKEAKAEIISKARLSPATSTIRNITPPPQTKPDTDYRLNNFKQEDKTNNPVLVMLLVLVVLIGTVGSWKYFSSTEDMNPSNVDVKIDKYPAPENQDDEPEQTITKDHSTTTTQTESQVSSLTVQEEVFTQTSGAEFTEDVYEATEQNTTILPSEEIDNSHITDSNADNIAAFVETLSDSDLPTIIIPVEDIQPVEKNIGSGINIKPEVKSPKPFKSETIIYTVVRGDTFWAIAGRFVNNPYKYTELAAQNKIINPDLIYPGNKIRIIKISR